MPLPGSGFQAIFLKLERYRILVLLCPGYGIGGIGRLRQGVVPNGTKLRFIIGYVPALAGGDRAAAQGASPGNGMPDEVQPAKRATDDFLSPPEGLFC